MDWQMVITVVTAVAGILGIFKGVEVYFVRRRTVPSMVPNDTQAGLTGSGAVRALSYVMSDECRAIHAGLRESMERQTSSIQDVRESVIRLEGKMETAIADVGRDIVEAVKDSTTEHEGRFHRGSGTTGDFKKVR